MAKQVKHNEVEGTGLNSDVRRVGPGVGDSKRRPQEDRENNPQTDNMEENENEEGHTETQTNESESKDEQTESK